MKLKYKKAISISLAVDERRNQLEFLESLGLKFGNNGDLTTHQMLASKYSESQYLVQYKKGLCWRYEASGCEILFIESMMPSEPKIYCEYQSLKSCL